MKKILKTIITLIFLITIVGCAKDERIENELLSKEYTYSVNSKMDLLIARNFNYKKDELSNYNFLISNNNNLYIENSYLINLELGKQEVNFSLGNIDYTLNVLIVEYDKPYLVNHLNIKYNEGEDLELIFDMLDFEFYSINGNEMNDSDYEFSNNAITVFKSYLDQEFRRERESLVLIMMYHENNNYSNVFITIKK